MEIEDNEQEILLEQENISVGGGAVNSVNGQVGDVVLTTSDLENTSDYQTGSEVESAISTAVGAEATAREQADTRLDTAISGLTDALATETTARVTADTNLQSQIDGITASSDVTDIVGTYAQLQAYDTSTLGDNDIIKVLQDESQNGETTYYRWSTATQNFTLIGEEGPYYTKSQTDTLLADKQNTLTAGTGIDITNDVISTTGGSGPTVAQTTGTSTTDVMSQNAVSSMVFADPGTDRKIQIGKNASATGSNLVVIGYGATAGSALTHQNTVAIGYNATAGGGNRVAIGASTNAGQAYSVALGSGAYTSYIGELNISTGVSGNHGYNSSNYRLLTGLYDPQNDHDAATKGYVDTAVAGAGGGGAIELTSADFNYPADNPTAVALWLLPPGVYYTTTLTISSDASTSQVLTSTSTQLPNQQNMTTFLALESYGGVKTIIGANGNLPSSLFTNGQVLSFLNVDNTGNYQGGSALLQKTNVKDNLTSTSTDTPLSANQGKILNDKITALEARVAALEGN